MTSPSSTRPLPIAPRPLLLALRLTLGLLCALLASTCTSSESHIGKTKSFLSECSADAPCADPEQSCFCFCTVACESTETCSAELERLGLTVDPTRIACRAPSCEGTSSDVPADVTGICDVSCGSDADCAIFGAEHRCLGGFCRLEAVLESSTAGNCPADMTFVAGDGAGNPDDFCLERYEVTVFGYQACVDGAACAAPAQGNFYTEGRDDHPIQFVAAADAEAYCAFVGRRLPTLGEWQWAAQNGAALEEYPWGSVAPSPADVPPLACALTVTDTCSIGSRPAGDSALGIADLSGNVAELVDDSGMYCSAGGGYTADAAGLASTSCVPFVAPASDVGFRCAGTP